MKKMSEVQKTLGFTRNALRWYIKKGLLNPKMIDGCLLYDDEEFKKAKLIQILLLAGYNLDEIKSRFDNPPIINDEIYAELMEKLLLKRKAIDSKIAYLTILKQVSSMPKLVLDAFAKLSNSADCFINDNIVQLPEELGDIYVNLAPATLEQLVKAFAYLISLIDYIKENHSNNAIICSRHFVSLIYNFYLNENEIKSLFNEVSILTDKEELLYMLIIEFIDTIIEQPSYKLLFNVLEENNMDDLFWDTLNDAVKWVIKKENG